MNTKRKPSLRTAVACAAVLGLTATFAGPAAATSYEDDYDVVETTVHHGEDAADDMAEEVEDLIAAVGLPEECEAYFEEIENIGMDFAPFGEFGELMEALDTYYNENPEDGEELDVLMEELFEEFFAGDIDEEAALIAMNETVIDYLGDAITPALKVSLNDFLESLLADEFINDIEAIDAIDMIDEGILEECFGDAMEDFPFEDMMEDDVEEADEAAAEANADDAVEAPIVKDPTYTG